MRVLVPLVAFAALIAVIAHQLYMVHSAWSVTLAILVAGGGVVMTGIVLRYGFRPTWRRRRALPSDPGFPREPLGAPYRGPRF